MAAQSGEDIVVGSPTSVYDVLAEESRELRWYVLSVACFLTFGSYYIYDFPGSVGSGSGSTIENHFIEQGKTYTESMNQYLYSVYAWPNTVLSVAGGLLIDKYLGLRRAMLLFTSLILLGSVVFYFGVRATAYWMLITGRVIFGLGGESLSVAQSAFVARWFKGRRGMALAFGITISFSRVGSSFNFLFAPAIANRWGVGAAAVSGIAACFVSVAACGVLVLADRYAERTGYLTAAATAEERDVAAESEAMRLSDIVRMPFAYWLLCAVCVFCYTSIFPFMGVGKNFFEVKYGYTGDQAARYLSFYQITSAVASPAIGLAVDSVGRNTWWLILACSCFAAIHVLFMITLIPGAALMVLMGCVYSFLVSGLWPSVPWAVSDSVVGVAYGAMTSIQNIGLASFPMLVGAILDHFRTSDSSGSGALTQELPPLVAYMWTEALFLLSALLALLASVVLLTEDRRTGGVLSAPSHKRLQIVEELTRQQNDFDGVVPDLEDLEDEEEAPVSTEPAASSGAALVDALPVQPRTRSHSVKSSHTLPHRSPAHLRKMPSRAVLRKKQRRDAKRKKAGADGGAPSHRTRPAHLDDDDVGARTHRPALLPPSRRLPEVTARAAAPAARKRAAEASLGVPSPSASLTPADAAAVVPLAHPTKRARVEAAAPAPVPEGLSRKERHRWETSQRLERQMTRLNTTAAATKEMLEEAAAQQPSSHGASGAEAAAAEAKLRHDPKFKNGTFWRDRKERRARTLFLGGIPAPFTVAQVKDFISTVVDSDPNAADYVDQIGKEVDVVEEVDMLPAKHHGKVKHMYVTMASVALAGCAAAMLDRYKMEGRELRCNFAADKTQREEAIRRRSAAQS